MLYAIPWKRCIFMDFSNLDFSTLQDIPVQFSYYEIPKLSINAQGKLAMNSALRKKVGDQREFRARITPDGYYLALYLEGPYNIRFSSKSGTAHHAILAQQLKKNGIQLPATYCFEWCEPKNAWVGCCQELPPLPALPTASQAKKRRSHPAAQKTT